MTVAFPTLPRGTVVTPQLVRYGGDLVSSLGGPTQRITRPGSRYAVEVQLPTLDADCAAQWLAAALSAEAAGDTNTLVVPQMIAEARDMAGVSGTGTAGTAKITVVGAVPPVGAFLSMLANGRHHLHLVTGVAGLDLTVAPLLRYSFAGLPLHIANPKLEGYCDETSWSLEHLRFVGHTFTITEAA